jgi:serine/tyrosine/threonine adenylyltransferase
MQIEEIEAIWVPIAEADDWGMLTEKVTAITSMGDAMG